MSIDRLVNLTETSGRNESPAVSSRDFQIRVQLPATNPATDKPQDWLGKRIGCLNSHPQDYRCDVNDDPMGSLDRPARYLTALMTCSIALCCAAQLGATSNINLVATSISVFLRIFPY